MKRMKRAVSLFVVPLALVAVVLLAGCAATTSDRYAIGGAAIGTPIGAAVGAGIGYILGDPEKGAIAGAIAGGAIGAQWGSARGATIEQQQAAIAAAQAAAQAAAVGATACTRQERWSGGKLVVDELNCTSSTTRAGFRGDPVPPGAPPPAVLYGPSPKEINPYAAAPQ